MTILSSADKIIKTSVQREVEQSSSVQRSRPKAFTREEGKRGGTAVAASHDFSRSGFGKMKEGPSEKDIYAGIKPIDQSTLKYIESNYFGKPGPAITHAVKGKSFKFGTREFTVERKGGGIMAKDVPRQIDLNVSQEILPEQKTFVPLNTYLKKFEAEERQRCKSINLSLLNEQVNSSDDDMGDIAEEFDKDDEQ